MLSVKQAWIRVQSFLNAGGKNKYAPETIADCGDCFVFSVRLKTDSPGVSTGLNPYIVYKESGKVVNDTKLKLIRSMRPIRMIPPNSIAGADQ